MKKSLTQSFVAFIIITGTSLLLSSDVVAQQKKSLQPNIIFILTEDQRWDAMGYAGNKIISSPEIDKLAREELYFKNAFVTTPICAASRAGILTGVQERTSGYSFGPGNIKDSYMKISYAYKMKNSGYYTGFYGKFGVRYDSIHSLFP